MKYILVIFIMFLLSGFLNAQSKAVIGMNINEVKNIYPGMKSSVYENTTTLERSESLYGLDGKWGYRFTDDKLDWIFFSKYVDELNDENFNQCLSAATKLIKDYSAYYGNPDTTITGNTKFIDPYVQRHWGYDVLEARWSNVNGMKIKIEFNFMGGKGEYHFIVSVNYFDKDYPYYN